VRSMGLGRICVTKWLLIRLILMVELWKYEINRFYLSGISVAAERSQATAGDF